MQHKPHRRMAIPSLLSPAPRTERLRRAFILVLHSRPVAPAVPACFEHFRHRHILVPTQLLNQLLHREVARDFEDAKAVKAGHRLVGIAIIPRLIDAPEYLQACMFGRVKIVHAGAKIAVPQLQAGWVRWWWGGSIRWRIRSGWVGWRSTWIHCICCEIKWPDW